MSRRWAVILPLVHVALSVTWVWQHNVLYWPQLPYLQKIEDFTRAHPPATEYIESPEDWDSVGYEARPSLEERAAISADPIPVLLAGFDFPWNFPFSTTQPRSKLPILGPLLRPLASHLRIKTRILVLDTVLITLIGMQWAFLGWRLDDSSTASRSRSRLKSPALQITALAFLITILNLLCLVTEFALRSTLEIFGGLCSVVAVFIWIAWGLIAVTRLVMALPRILNRQTPSISK